MNPLHRYVLRNLYGRPYPTLIVLATMAIVGGVVGGIGAVAINLRAVLANAGRPEQVIVLSRTAVSEFDSSLSVDAQHDIAVGDLVRAASREILYRTETWRPDHTLELALVRGLEDAGVQLHGGTLVDGRWPAAGNQELVVGTTLLDRHPELGIGRTVAVGRHAFTCVGVFKTGDTHDGEMWTSRTALDQEINFKGVATEMLLKAGGASQAHTLAEQLSANPRFAIRAVPEDEYYQSLVASFRPIYLGLLVLLFLVTIGAALAAMSVLSVVFGQRVGDLAVLKTIGFRQPQLSRLLLVETQLLAIGGGALGTAAAALALRNYVAFIALPGGGSIVNFHANVSLLVAAATLSVMLLIGALAAAQPIARLRRLDLRESLRLE